jgi:hypothetical protein
MQSWRKEEQTPVQSGGTYRYARVSHLYVALKQNPLAWPWYVLKRMRPLSIIRKKPSRRGVAKHLPPPLNRWYSLSRMMLEGTKVQITNPDQHEVISLPIEGHIAIPLSLGGYKVINFASDTVTTLFPRNHDPKQIARHVRKARQLGRYPFVPHVTRYNLKEGWLEEAYVNGSPLSDTELYDARVVSLLADIALAAPPKRIMLGEYLDMLLMQIKEDAASLPNSSVRQQLERFCQGTVGRLQEFRQQEICLVLSHGDAWRSNILDIDGKLVAIDWGASGDRSLLYDLHFAKFILLEPSQAPDLSTVRDALTRALEEFMRNLEARAPERLTEFLPNDVPLAVFRSLFYLEFLVASLHEYREVPAESVRTHRVRRITLFLKVFMDFERLISGNATPSNIQRY